MALDGNVGDPLVDYGGELVDELENAYVLFCRFNLHHQAFQGEVIAAADAARLRALPDRLARVVDEFLSWVPITLSESLE